MKPSIVLFLTVSAVSFTASQGAEPLVEAIRTPDGGIQPQAVVDREGSLHLIDYNRTVLLTFPGFATSSA